MSASVMPLDSVVQALLKSISPSGTLQQVADEVQANVQVDNLLKEFTTLQGRIDSYHQKGVVARLEDDFAQVVKAIAPEAGALESWGIPLLSAFAGPWAPFVSFGLSFACKLALAALQGWADKRLKPGA